MGGRPMMGAPMAGGRPRRGLAVRGLFALLLVGAMAFLIWKLFT